MRRHTLLLFALLTLPLASCRHETAPHPETGTYRATPPLRQDVEITNEYVAQLRAIQHIEVRALEGGYLEGTFVDEGQLVHAGAPMFQVMPRLFEAELQRARAEASFTEIEFQNTELLAKDGVVAPSELALARAKFDKANAELALAQVHRDLSEIRAPFTGIMGRLLVRKGSLVDEGELLTTLSDNSTLWVYFNVTEAEYLDYLARADDVPELPLRLAMSDGRMYPHTGRIDTIEADFNNETGNIAFRASFPNPDAVLRHGQTGNVLLSRLVPGALLIPQKATFEVLDRRYVFVVDAEHVAHQREIEVAHELPQLFVVAAGLEEDETILLEGLRKVRDGAQVEVSVIEPSAAIASLEVPAE